MPNIFDGAKLRVIRKEFGFTLEKMAELLNTSASYLSDIENNKSNPGLELLINLRKELHIDLNYFLAESLEWKVAEQKLNYNHTELKNSDEAFEKIESLANEILQQIKDKKRKK